MARRKPVTIDAVTVHAVTVEPKRPGRSSTFTQALADEICARLSDGEPLRQICRDPHMPAWRTVYLWREAHPAFDAAIARARIPGFDAIAEETLEIIDTFPMMADSESGSRIDSAHVAWLKNRVEQRMKLLAKWDPKRFGDKLALGGAEDMPPIQQNVTLDPAEAYKRLLGGA
jgi:hypothetical protein